MTYEIIENLVEKLTKGFFLATPEAPESLSGLLPILKQIHVKCNELSLNTKAKQVLKARKIINSILKNPSKDGDKKITALGELISRISSPISVSEEPDQASARPSGPAPDVPDLNQIEKSLAGFADLIGGFCPGEIPDLGAMLNILDELIKVSQEKDFVIFHEVSIACKGYVETMTLENIYDTKPIEEGLVLLKSILFHLKKGKIFSFDCSDVFQLLNVGLMEECQSKEPAPGGEDPDSEVPDSTEPAQVKEDSSTATPEELEKIDDDDMEILMDFVSEAGENLDTIEVNLIELEQDPSNTDIINDIFRPFHTIKGVSGFLSLTKINKLAHTTENLLDSARSGDFLINDIATDVILESVDTLKKLIDRIRQGTNTGFR